MLDIKNAMMEAVNDIKAELRLEYMGLLKDLAYGVNSRLSLNLFVTSLMNKRKGLVLPSMKWDLNSYETCKKLN